MGKVSSFFQITHLSAALDSADTARAFQTRVFSRGERHELGGLLAPLEQAKPGSKSPYRSSIPSAPASQSRSRRYHPAKSRKARCWRAFAIGRKSLNSQIGEFSGQSGESLRRLPQIFPFSGDSCRRPVGSALSARRGTLFTGFSGPNPVRSGIPSLDCRPRTAVLIPWKL